MARLNIHKFSHVQRIDFRKRDIGRRRVVFTLSQLSTLTDKNGGEIEVWTEFCAEIVVRSGPEVTAVMAKIVAGRRVVLMSLFVMR